MDSKIRKILSIMEDTEYQMHDDSDENIGEMGLDSVVDNLKITERYIQMVGGLEKARKLLDEYADLYTDLSDNVTDDNQAINDIANGTPDDLDMPFNSHSIPKMFPSNDTINASTIY